MAGLRGDTGLTAVAVAVTIDGDLAVATVSGERRRDSREAHLGAGAQQDGPVRLQGECFDRVTARGDQSDIDIFGGVMPDERDRETEPAFGGVDDPRSPPGVDLGMPALLPHPGRRAFLTLTGAALGAAPLHALSSRAAAAIRGQSPAVGRTRGEAGYGPLGPVRDETTGLPLLHLPAGFRYLTFGWTGDPLADGRPTPPAHDGMAAFAAGGSRIRLVRNHEVRSGGAFADRPLYDEIGGGGTTTVEFDTATGTVRDAWTSLAGTAVNCAGGPTPWGSWLTCEETVHGPGFDPSLLSSLSRQDIPDYRRPHGYVFDVPADGAATAEPLRAMGRFVHEAVSVDPATGIVYETEDRGASGFYRFLPNEAGNLAAGGRLEMLAVAGAPQSDLRKGQSAGAWRPVSWVPIEDPDPAETTDHSVFEQGAAGGGATFARLEGTWYGGGRVFIVSTDGGEAEAGQVWEYDPGRERLRLIFESPGKDVLDMPDNICVSPRGGLVLCEDGATDNYVRGLALDGGIFPFARNNVVVDGERNGFAGDFRAREFAGATYSPDGRWLFFNAQTPGITFAVTGPWAGGSL